MLKHRTDDPAERAWHIVEAEDRRDPSVDMYRLLRLYRTYLKELCWTDSTLELEESVI